MKTNKVEQQVISKQHPLWKIIDDMCFKSKNLYNYANYIIRQEFITTGKYIDYPTMNKNLKTESDYKSCMSQPANCTLILRDDHHWRAFRWKSFW